MPSYKPVLTLAGQALVAQAMSGGPAVTIAQIAVGDGNGQAVTPIETQTHLVNERWRGAVASAARDPNAPTQVVITAAIPSSAGPMVMREIGIIASTGELFAVGNTPEHEISVASQGAETVVEITFVVVVSTAATVTVQLDAASLIGLPGLLRAPFISIDSFSVAPPANPALGALVVAAANATGAFAGLDGKFVQWNGSLWLSCVAPLGTVVHNIADGIYYKRTAAGWVEWLLSEADQGPAFAATLAEAKASSTWVGGVVITPEKLYGVLRKSFTQGGVAETGDSDLLIAEGLVRAASANVYADTGANGAGFVAAPVGNWVGPKAPFLFCSGRTVPAHDNAANAVMRLASWGDAIANRKLLDWQGTALAAGVIKAGRPFDWLYVPTADTGAGAFIVMPWSLVDATNVGKPFNQKTLTNSVKAAYAGADNSIWPAVNYAKQSATSRVRVQGLISAVVPSAGTLHGYNTVQVKLGGAVQSQACGLAPTNYWYVADEIGRAHV
jgi:hypothetical protein